MTDLILGIDGGGSKTRALLADRYGAMLGVGTADSSNYHSVGFEAATRALQSAIAEALKSAGVDPATLLAAACFGLGGVDRPADHDLWTAWIEQEAIAQRYTIVNDSELVLVAGTPDGWGVALICGTGSICYGRAPDGATTRAGGWGHLLGDEGSGYDISVQALRRATQTADGRAEAHAILREILRHWELDEPSQLIGYVYRPEMRRAEIATLARLVVALAAQGDPYARDILEGAAFELGRLIAVVVQKLGLRRPPVALGGSLVGANPALQQGICKQAGVELGPLRYVEDPAQGALVMARSLLE